MFNNNSDDDDSQPETTSAISTSEPPKSRHSLSDNDEDEGDEDDDERLPTTSSRSPYNKPVISIHIGRSLSTALEGETSSPSSSQVIEASSPYSMVKFTR